MRIAVFDHQLNNGGGRRFLLNLLSTIATIDKDIYICLYCNLGEVSDSSYLNEFIKRGIIIKQLASLEKSKEFVTKFTLLKRGYRYVLRQINPRPTKEKNIAEDLNSEILSITKNFDIAYFPWPYLLNPPNTECPKVATFHDFNFKYFFGVPIYSEEQIDFLNVSLKEWMKDATAIVSTNFMANELRGFYPDVKSISVIHLASLNMYLHKDLITDDEFEYKYLLDKPYILFPVHLTSHKNIGNAIAATSIINQKGLKFKLVLTGGYTEHIKGRSNYCGLETGDSTETDVEGLGYISDKQMHYLQYKAFAVLNTSLYEAGNGVGLDAWSLGVPVIQSDIPAFEEHIKLQGVRAFTFDPRNANDVARAITECFESVEKRQYFVKESLAASKKMTWEITANKYLKIFTDLTQRQINGN